MNNGLLPFIVLYTDDTFNVPQGAFFNASDAAHAEEQFLSENLYAEATCVVQTDDTNQAFDV